MSYIQCNLVGVDIKETDKRYLKHQRLHAKTFLITECLLIFDSEYL